MQQEKVNVIAPLITSIGPSGNPDARKLRPIGVLRFTNFSAEKQFQKKGRLLADVDDR